MTAPDLEVTIEREPVESSNIHSAGYDEPTHTLEVQFSSSAIYRYGGVPSHVAWPLTDEAGAWAFAAVTTGQATAHISRPKVVLIESMPWSVGQYFDAAIKKGDYPFEAISR